MIRAAAKNHAYAAVVVSPASLRRRPRGAARPTTARCRCRRASGSPPRRSPTPRATTPRSRAGSPRRREDFPQPPRPRLREGRSTCPTARTRTSAPPTTRRSARARTCSRTCASTTASRSRTTTSSTSTPRARSLRDLGERPACVIVKHNNPCGAAVGSDRLDAYRARLRVRPDQRLRRRHRAQPPGRPRDGAGARRAVRRGPVRARLRGRRARGARAPSPNVRLLEDQERRGPLPGERGHPPGRRAACSSRTATSSAEDRDQMDVVTERAPDRGRSGATCSSPGASAAT